MRRGITFEMPNEYGSLLGRALKPIDISSYDWLIGSGESYNTMDGQLTQQLFMKDRMVGAELKNLLETAEHYIISADLQAFPKDGAAGRIETYEEFMEKNCELALLVVDSSYVTIYAKEQASIELLYENALVCGFENVEYLTDENDSKTRISIW